MFPIKGEENPRIESLNYTPGCYQAAAMIYWHLSRIGLGVALWP
jgi:hypothetical protein